MKRCSSVYQFLVVVAFVAVSLTTQAGAQSFEIRFDYANAEATLKALSAKGDTDLGSLLNLDSKKAVIAKRASRDPRVTAKTYTETLAQVRDGNTPKLDPFQWTFCLQQQPAIQQLLAQLRDQEPAIRARLVAALSPQMDPSRSLTVTVH